MFGSSRPYSPDADTFHGPQGGQGLPDMALVVAMSLMSLVAGQLVISILGSRRR